MNGPPLLQGLQRLVRLGLLIADKKPGPFRVVLVLSPRSHHDKAISNEIQKAISGAIDRGVPIFNGGDAAGVPASTEQCSKSFYKSD